MKTVHTEGADIAFDIEGSGPLLLMIPGRGGTGGRYTGVSAQLKDEYRVVRFDRRCCGRSTGDASRAMDLTQQARDALAIAQALGETRAFVFGNSAGASIALRIAEYFPERVLGVIAHEPMTLSVLPDREDWVDFNRRVDHLYRTEGVPAAMKLLATSMVGLQAPAGVPPRPGPEDDMKFFLENEFMSLCYYRPDLDRLKRNGVRLIATKGQLSADAYYARTADVIGERVGCPVRTMSGNHIAHVVDPIGFAGQLRAVLSELKGASPI
jgi:pimeloyl-ACP methyl ester carboxylesterase